ncbi:T9SS type A sorting domain-containing protein [Flavobacteriales bacterium]|nr:T9SS type A sorting domain-containing protein [Flavobacteriales bacterium]MDB2361958.1 T9SS type A sorting domain-containing protein [Flavobacteriales bacterium]
MKYLTLLSLLFLSLSSFGQQYSNPESVDYDSNGEHYLISNSNEGKILSYDLENDVLETFISGVGAGPHGLEVVGNEVYACSGSRLKAYDLQSGEETVNINLGATFANGITHKVNDVFVTDFSGKDIFRYNITSGSFNMYIQNLPVTPNGILYDEIEDRLLVVCWGANAPIYEIDMSDSTYTTVASTSLGYCDGIAMDNNGDFYVSAWSNDAVNKFNSDFSGGSTVVVPNMSSPADIYYNRDTDVLAIPNSENNTVIFESFGSSISFTCGLMGCMELSDNTGKYTTLEDCEADCETIALDEFNTEERLFYPNPIQNGGNIIWQSEDAEVEIYNLQGQLILSEQINKNQILELPLVKKGFYLLKTNDKQERILIH